MPPLSAIPTFLKGMVVMWGFAIPAGLLGALASRLTKHRSDPYFDKFADKVGESIEFLRVRFGH